MPETNLARYAVFKLLNDDLTIEGPEDRTVEIFEAIDKAGFAVVPKEPTQSMLHKVWLHPVGERRFSGEVKPENEVLNTETSASIYRKLVVAAQS